MLSRGAFGRCTGPRASLRNLRSIADHPPDADCFQLLLRFFRVQEFFLTWPKSPVFQECFVRRDRAPGLVHTALPRKASATNSTATPPSFLKGPLVTAT